MGRSLYRQGIVIAVGLLCLVFAAAPASADEFPYVLEPELSLTGDCSTSALDPIPDPSCPYAAPPAGPSGRFNKPLSVAIDAYGNEYIANPPTGRIDIFSDSGEFILELTGLKNPRSVAVDSVGNLYVFVEGPVDTDIVRYAPSEYEPLVGKIAYGNSPVVVDSRPAIQGSLVIDPSNDRLYVAWWDTFISEYKSAPEGNGLAGTITHPELFANQRIAVDGQRRRIYASTCLDNIFECVVFVLDADAPHNLLEVVDGSTTPLGEYLSASGAISLAVDEANGHFFVGDLSALPNVYEYGEDFGYLSTTKLPAVQFGSPQLAVSNSPLNPAARNLEYLFAPLNQTSGSVLAFEPPEIREPVVEVGVGGIAETEAEMRATIDPEGGDTEYVLEYVSEAQFEVSGFDDATVVAEGTVPGPSTPQTVGVFVSGLEPGGHYFVRAFGENPIGSKEDQTSFATYADASPNPQGQVCPNEAMRDGASATLPDCRAYELVTPPDTNGNPTKGAGLEGDRFTVGQSSPSGGLVSFELLGGALPGTEATGGFYGDPYLASRGPTGWSTALTGPDGTQTSKPRPGSFSPDQGYNFWVAAGDGSDVLGGLETHWVRYPDGHSEVVGRGSLGTDPRAEGKLITKDGSHIVFQTASLISPPVQLEPNAPPTGTRAIYDRTADEVTHVVSLLPGNVTPSAGQNAEYQGASADGEGIAFTIGSTLYLRVGNTTTYNIGTGVQFAGVSEGGARIFYVQGGDLKAFDVEDEAVVDFTPVTDAVPVNVASDGTSAYFVSETAIGGSGPNPNGANPQAGEQNLYLSEEGTISFVGTVTEGDVDGRETASGPFEGLGLWTQVLPDRKLAADPSRLNADGSVMLFESEANLDGYDSDGSRQVYRYDGARLDCISCPPTKTAPIEGASLQSFFIFATDAPFGPYGFVQSLRADGNRAFFESTEALVSADTDGERDVYEWEEEDVGSCTKPGGCIYLISPGNSETDEYLFGHSESGDDAFFTTNEILTADDETTLSVYDARVGGGFAQKTPDDCQGEGCRPGMTPPPSTPTPTSESLGRITEVPGKKPPKTCPKGKKKVKQNGKVRCVKKKKPAKQKNKQKAGNRKKGGRR